MYSRKTIYVGGNIIHTDSHELGVFLAARARGTPSAELRELKMAAQMSQATAHEIGGRNSAAMPHRAHDDRGVSSLVAARIVARELLLDHARYAARTAMTEDEYRSALRLRDRALGRNGE
jgi:hypothetical protein